MERSAVQCGHSGTFFVMANLPSRTCYDGLFAFQTTTTAGIDARAHVISGQAIFLQKTMRMVSEGQLGRVLDLLPSRDKVRKIDTRFYVCVMRLNHLGEYEYGVN